MDQHHVRACARKHDLSADVWVSIPFLPTYLFNYNLDCSIKIKIKQVIIKDTIMKVIIFKTSWDGPAWVFVRILGLGSIPQGLDYREFSQEVSH